MTKNEAAAEIARIAKSLPASEWTSVVTIAEHTDMTPAELSAGLVALAREGRINLAPESNQKMLTAMDHAYAVRFGGQDKHILSWM
jgi:predicted Rossmann fold nucleotide-binding protein DprA/Smf involved in DNA uptake